MCIRVYVCARVCVCVFVCGFAVCVFLCQNRTPNGEYGYGRIKRVLSSSRGGADADAIDAVQD